MDSRAATRPSRRDQRKYDRASTGRRIGATLLVLTTTIALPGCGEGAGDARWRDAGADSTAEAVAAPSPTPPSEVTLAFAGDAHFAGRTLTLLNGAPSTAFGPIGELLSSADLSMVNVETAVTTRGTPEPKEFHFRAPASTFEAVRGAGIDVVTIANNHALDYGRVGLTDTIEAAKAAGIPVVGAGQDAAGAYAPWIGKAGDVRVAFIAVSQVHELESSWAARDNRPGIAMAADGVRAAAAVRAARQSADIVVVYAHWGHEGNGCPVAEQRSFARQMADAGADLVVGTHAHLLLGDGWLGKTYVAYGLGNFLWWRDDAFSNDTGVLKVTIRDRAVAGVAFVPAVISRTTGQPMPATGPDEARLRAKFSGLRRCTGLADAPPPPASPASPQAGGSATGKALLPGSATPNSASGPSPSRR